MDHTETDLRGLSALSQISINSSIYPSSSSASLVQEETSQSSTILDATAKDRRVCAKDFLFLNMIGEGSFSTVYRCKRIEDDRLYAIKVCDKKLILKEKKTAYVMREKQVMAILTKEPHPFFVQLFAAFQDLERLYFVMTLAPNGELLNYLHKLGSFDEEVTKFYSAEIIVALEYLHNLNIIHRDLKPENILLSEKMHVLITDFGSSKILCNDNDRPTPLLPQNLDKKRGSFVGTAQYVSPEVLNGAHATFSCDLWALGCILYQMLSGLPPFRAPNEYLIFQKITKLDYTFPDGFPDTAMQLVQELLKLEPTERLGDEVNGGMAKLKAHEFFNGTDWTSLPEQTPPDILPYLPASRGSQSFHSRYKVPDNVEPGLDDKQMTRLLGLLWEDMSTSASRQHILSIKPVEREKRLLLQRKENPYNRFVEDHLIIKSGLLDKRKGLFARRRMFLLCEGPNLYYVDPVNMEYKGKIPWSKEMRLEGKNFRIFFVHTPNRTYYLEDPNNKAYEWCEILEQVRQYYFCRSDKKEDLQ